jgi:hypothetical protein
MKILVTGATGWWAVRWLRPWRRLLVQAGAPTNKAEGGVAGIRCSGPAASRGRQWARSGHQSRRAFIAGGRWTDARNLRTSRVEATRS